MVRILVEKWWRVAGGGAYTHATRRSLYGRTAHTCTTPISTVLILFVPIHTALTPLARIPFVPTHVCTAYTRKGYVIITRAISPRIDDLLPTLLRTPARPPTRPIPS